MSHLARSVLAIVAGFLLIGALSFGTDVALVSAGVYGPDGQPGANVGLLLLRTAYVAVYAITGCWLAAYLAPGRPMLHALVLGAVGLVFNVAGAVAGWGVVPAWYIVLNLLLVMVYAWIGGRIREAQIARAPAVANS